MTSTTHEFYSALYGNTVHAGAQLVIWQKGRGSAWCDSIESACTVTASLSARDNAYFGVALQDPEAMFDHVRAELRRNHQGQGRAPEPRSIEAYRGFAASAALIPGLWIDLDVATGDHKKKGLPSSMEVVRDFVAGCEFAPSIVVETGGGLHAYWLFDQPWVLEDEEERGRAAALLRRWQDMERRRAGFTIDPTADLPRVLRPVGTINHKYGSEVTAEIFEGIRYSVTELIDFVEEQGRVPLGSDSVEVATVAKVNVTEADGIDSQKLLDLMNLHPQFNLTWLRERDDLPSQSEYDLALATIAARSGWNTDEIASLIVEHRRQGGEDLKLDRPDYYGRTISKAFGGIQTERAAERLTESAEDLADDARSEPTESTRMALHRDLSAMLGLRIARVEKYLGDPPTFRLVMESGSIDLGPVKSILDPAKFRECVAALCSVVIPRYKHDPWAPIAQAILRAAVTMDTGEYASTEALVASWIRAYLEQTPPVHDLPEAITAEVPFQETEGAVLIGLESLIRFLQHGREERVGRQDLTRKLRACGLATTRVNCQMPTGERQQPRLWRVRRTWLDAQPAPPEEPQESAE